MWRNSSLKIIWQTLWRYSKGSRKFLLTAILMMVLADIFDLATPYAIGKIINVLQEHGQSGVDQAFFWIYVIIAVKSFYAIINSLGVAINKKFSRIVSHSFMKDYYKKSQALPLLWHQDHHSGDLVSRLNKANNAVGAFVDSPSQLIWMIVGFFGPAFIILGLMPIIGAFVLIVCVITIGLTIFFDKKIKHYATISNGIFHRVSSTLNDYLGNIRTVITLRLGLQTQRDIQNRLKETIPPFNKEVGFKLGRWVSTEILMETMIVLSLVYLINMFRKNDPALQIGNIVMVATYLRQMASSVYNSSRYYGSLIQSVVDFKGFDLVDDAYEEYSKTHKENEFDIQSWSNISIKNLSFGYATQQEITALDNLSFAFRAGEKIALVGASGGGKSTLMSVLRGLYPAQQGTTEIDGTAYPNIEPLASISTLIPQDPEIFENTIRYNITLGVEHSDAEIMEACRIACFDTVIDELPNGLDSKINEKGVNLSGGQKQRLALARGIFAIQDSSLVLFDEPTSSVDSMTERLMYKNLFGAFPEICLISSIHRLNLLTQFDTIWVMQNGRMVQQGTLEELLIQTDMPFYQLWNAYQSEETN